VEFTLPHGTFLRLDADLEKPICSCPGARNIRAGIVAAETAHIYGSQNAEQHRRKAASGQKITPQRCQSRSLCTINAGGGRSNPAFTGKGQSCASMGNRTKKLPHRYYGKGTVAQNKNGRALQRARLSKTMNCDQRPRPPMQTYLVSR